MTLEEYKKEVEKNIKSLFEKANEEEKELLNTMVNLINDLCEEKQELIDYLNKEIEELTKEYYLENQQLKDNWNKLKQYLLNGVSSNNYITTENSMLYKMQELEKSDK